jgi:prepilin-type N-terminal cleavage/methylation domain-containing protein
LAPGLARRFRRGFTLAEVLASLAFIAIVIPVAVEGLRVAATAGAVGQRKSVAIRVAERVLTESMILSQAGASSQNGTVEEGGLDYRWTIETKTWPEDTMRLVTALVTFEVQGEEHSVSLSTLTGTTSP